MLLCAFCYALLGGPIDDAIPEAALRIQEIDVKQEDAAVVEDILQRMRKAHFERTDNAEGLDNVHHNATE